MLERIANLSDGGSVSISAGVLRALLQHTEPQRATAGAAIRNDGRGVTYFVTVDRQGAEVHLRTVEVVPDRAPADPRVWRIPERVLADTAAEVLALEDSSGDPEHTLVWGVDWPDPDRPPNAEELAQLINSKVTRKVIAKRYGRALGTVDQWLRVARKERPDLFPPRTRGPRPEQETPEAQGAPGSK